MLLRLPCEDLRRVVAHVTLIFPLPDVSSICLVTQLRVPRGLLAHRKALAS